MFVKILNRIHSAYRRVVTSIGFFPTAISVGIGLIAIGIIVTDTNKATTFLLENFPQAVIKDGDTARVILSTIVGGLVSLTVFSFTMVMAQLNRAASNYSPRLLPGLISTKRHQIVLGIFLGAITFCLIVLISIEPGDDSYQLPGMAILIAVSLGMTSLGVFVYFIHSISQAIQITNILQRVADETEDRLGILANDEQRHQQQEQLHIEDAHKIHSSATGYYQGCNRRTLVSLATENDLEILILPLRGEFVLEKTVLLELSKKIDDDLKEKILSCLDFSGNDLVTDNYVLGFKQITEIAVRAMSPGTNDPGTALNAIDHLTRLFSLRMQIDDREVHCDDEGNVRLGIRVVEFSELFYILLASLRLYCKHDVVIMLKLLQMFDYLLQVPVDIQEHHEAIITELDTLVTDAKESIKNERDLQAIEEKASLLRDHLNGEEKSELED